MKSPLGESFGLPVSRLAALLSCLVLVLSGCDAIKELFVEGPSPEQMADEAFTEGNALFSQGNLDAAEEAFRRALRANPQHGPAAFSLAKLYHERGEDSRALLELGSAERLLPDSREVFVLRGDILFGRGSYTESVRAYRQALAKGASPKVRRKMIVGLVRAGEIDAAKLELEVLRGIDEGGPPFDAVWGLVKAGEGDVNEARRILEEAARSSLDPEAPYALGWFLVHQGEPGRAVRALRQAVELGGDIGVVRLLVNALVEAGEPEAAAELIRPHRQSRPRDPLVHAAYAQALIGGGQYGDALEAAERALELDPRLAPAHLARGAALEASGRLDAAIESYRRAAREAPDYAEVYRYLAEAYKSRGRNADAIGALERLLALDPSDRRGALSLIELYVTSSAHPQRGLRLVNRLLESDPGNPELLRYRRRLQAQADAAAASTRRPGGVRKTPEIIRGR